VTLRICILRQGSKKWTVICFKIIKLEGLKSKDLVGIPWRVAFALQADGWYLRQDIIWHKPNPMPESVQDRCTKAHEYIFLLSKSAKYYYDNEAIKEDSAESSKDRLNQDIKNQKGSSRVPGKTNGI
jgi:DNA modification methylase